MLSSVVRLCFLVLNVIALFIINQASASDVQHVANVRVYVDKSGLEKWMYITKKGQNDLEIAIESTFLEISEMMKSLKKYGVNIVARLESLTFLPGNVVPTGPDKKANANELLRDFYQYAAHSYRSNPYDVALLYTGHDIYDKDPLQSSIFGLAYPKRACHFNGAAIVEIGGTFLDVMITAHEIGHVLGAKHDGDNPFPCNEKGYIMQQYSVPNKNHFEYSKCSGREIREYIDLLNSQGRNCLLDGFKPINAPRYSTLMSADEICQRIVSPDSFVDRMHYYKRQDDRCIKLPCWKNGWFQDVQPPAVGLDCGVNKKCVLGKCVSGRNSVTSDKCPFGSSSNAKNKISKTCGQLEIIKCSGDITEFSACCEKCSIDKPGAGFTPDQVCQHRKNPNAYLQNNVSGDGLCSKIQCGWKTADGGSMSTSVDAPNGMTCGKNKSCKNGRCI